MKKMGTAFVRLDKCAQKMRSDVCVNDCDDVNVPLRLFCAQVDYPARMSNATLSGISLYIKTSSVPENCAVHRKKKNPNVTTEVLALLCSPASMLYYRRKIAHFTWTTAGCCGGAQTVVVAAPRFWGATLRDANKIEAFAEKSYGSIRKKRVDRPSKSCATSCLVDEIVGWEVSREEPRRGGSILVAIKQCGSVQEGALMISG
jgi:hypothetical protein